ncbi:MAG: alpha/beta hydrolase [Puniceicoccaceae bacterium]
MHRLSFRPILRFSFCLLVLCGLTYVLSAKPAYPPIIEGAQVETYKVAGEMELRLWIFNPEGHKPDDKTPAIVFFFGGGWNGGSPSHFARQSQYLASRGMVAAVADYRVKSRNGVPVKVCLEDAKSAVRWIRANAERLGIDPNHIAAGGGSAGGHLAAATAAVQDFDNAEEDSRVSSRPNALVLFNPVAVVGPVDGVSELDIFKSKHSHQRAGTDPVKLSPYHQAKEDMPPTILFHGTADETVPYVAAELFNQKLHDLGVRCELVTYDGAGHSFFNGPKYYEDTISKMDTFLVSIGYLEKQ